MFWNDSFENVENLVREEYTELATVSKKKLNYIVAEDNDDKYYCYGCFEKCPERGFRLYSDAEMDDEEAVKMFSGFRGTKAVSDYISDVLFFIFDAIF